MYLTVKEWENYFILLGQIFHWDSMVKLMLFQVLFIPRSLIGFKAVMSCPQISSGGQQHSLGKLFSPPGCSWFPSACQRWPIQNCNLVLFSINEAGRFSLIFCPLILLSCITSSLLLQSWQNTPASNMLNF